MYPTLLTQIYILTQLLSSIEQNSLKSSNSLMETDVCVLADSCESWRGGLAAVPPGSERPFSQAAPRHCARRTSATVPTQCPHNITTTPHTNSALVPHHTMSSARGTSCIQPITSLASSVFLSDLPSCPVCSSERHLLGDILLSLYSHLR